MKNIVIALGILLCQPAISTAAEGGGGERPDLSGCERREENLKKLEEAEAAYGRDDRECVRAVREARKVCLDRAAESIKYSDIKGQEGPDGVRPSVERMQTAYNTARDEAEKGADACLEAQRQLSAICQSESDSIKETLNEATRLSAQGANDPVNVQLRQDRENLEKYRSALRGAHESQASCFHNEGRIYSDASQQLEATKASIGASEGFLRAGAAVGEKMLDAGVSKGGALTGKLAAEKGAHAVAHAAEHALEHAGKAGAATFASTAGKAVPVVAGGIAAAKGDPAGVAMAAGCAAGPYLCGAAIGAGVVLAPTPTSRCDGVYIDPVGAYRANCPLTFQSIDSAVKILESK